MLYKIRKFINTIIDKIGIVIFLIVGIGMIFGGVMLWTVEKSMATVIPIVFGLVILTVPLGRLVKILFNKDFSFGTKHLVYCCFILMFLFFTGLLLWVMGTTVTAMINGETTTAQIDGMSSNGVPYVKYYVDGQLYREYLGSSSPGMYVGKEISVAYYPENPERLYHCGLSAFILPGICFLMMVAGLVFVIYLWISPIIKTVEKKTFEINSKTIWGVVDKIEQDLETLVYGEHPWVIYCSYRADDATFRCKSKSLNFDPTFCYNVGDPIQIRVDYNDFTNYEVVVDLTRMADAVTTE